MELSLSLPAAGMSVPEQVEYAKRAEDAGYRRAWVAETAGPDAFVLAAAVADATNLDLGTGVVPVYTRTPMALAMAASSVSQMTGGRFSLGIGSSSHNIVEGWGGVPFVKPLTRVRETVEVLRQAFAGQKVAFEGETLRMSNFRLAGAPKQHLPIYVGALNKKMLRLAGEVGDGCWVNMLGEDKVALIRAEYEAGAKEAGRQPGPMVCRMQTVITDTPAAAYQLIRGAMAGYVATPVYNKFFSWIGFADEAKAVAEAFGKGDRAGTAAAMTDELASQIVTAGSAGEIAERFARYGEAGIDDANMAVMVPGMDEATKTMEDVAKAWHKLMG